MGTRIKWDYQIWPNILEIKKDMTLFIKILLIVMMVSFCAAAITNGLLRTLLRDNGFESYLWDMSILFNIDKYHFIIKKITDTRISKELGYLRRVVLCCFLFSLVVFILVVVLSFIH